MKKIISGTMSLIMTAALFTQTMPIVADAVDTPVDMDKSLYEQVLKNNANNDTNRDGIISEDEFKNIDFLYINLTDVKDISGLKKAEGLRTIELLGGSVTDFSVLCNLKNLRKISIGSNPVTDVSYFKNMDLNFLYLNNTGVSDEDRISMIQTKDYEIPVGFVENFDLKPKGMMKTQFVIHDDQIAGFGEKGESNTEEGFYNNIVAKKEGETTYSVMYNEKEIAKGKIKVVPSDLKNPVSDSDGIKVNQIKNRYSNDQMKLSILTDDKKYYYYEDNRFIMIADRVKTAYDIYSYETVMGNANYILKEDGSFIINGKPVFEDGTKVSEICWRYALNEDGSLWYVIANDEGIEKTKICSDCDKLINQSIVRKKDGNVILVSCSVEENKFQKSHIYELGKMNVVDVYKTNACILDDEGNVWNIYIKDYNTAPVVTCIAKNAVKIGEVAINGSLSGPVYATADGKIYSCSNAQEIKSVNPDEIFSIEDYDYRTVYGGIYEKTDNYGFAYTSTYNATVAGVEICNDDRVYGRNVLYKDKSLYMTCLGKHMAISDVKDSYGAFYDKDANDFSIIILRNDNSLWKYCIAADTLTQITNDYINHNLKQITEPDEKFSVADIMSLSQYMLTGKALTDSQIKKYDMNTDGNINIIDVALLKEKLLSMAR